MTYIPKKNNNNNNNNIILHSNVKIQPFLRKLKLLVETCPIHIAGFDETGTIFEVLDTKQFAIELKKHYKGSDSTFIRQLHFYGFAKTDCTRNLRKSTNLPPALPGAWSFSHPFLVKHSLELMSGIQRHDKKEVDDSENAEINQLRQKIKTLEKTVAGLTSKLTTVVNFIEKKGFDLSSIESSSFSNELMNYKIKPISPSSETIGSSNSNKRPRLIENEEDEEEEDDDDENNSTFNFIDEMNNFNSFQSSDIKTEFPLLDLERSNSITSFFAQMDSTNIDELAESLTHNMSFDAEIAIQNIKSESNLEEVQEEEGNNKLKIINNEIVHDNNNNGNFTNSIDQASIEKIISQLKEAISSSNNKQNESMSDDHKDNNNNNSNSSNLSKDSNNSTIITTEMAATLLPILLSLPQIQSALYTLKNNSSNIIPYHRTINEKMNISHANHFPQLASV